MSNCFKVETIKLGDKKFTPFIRENKIREAVKKIAQNISEKYAETKPLFICVLKGAVFFATDLVRQLDIDAELTFIRVASYCELSSTGKIKILQPLIEPVCDREIILVDDVLDSGYTYLALRQMLLSQGAKSVALATLLYKPGAVKKKDLCPDFYGIEIGNEFVVGYGLDYNDMGRSLKNIYVLTE